MFGGVYFFTLTGLKVSSSRWLKRFPALSRQHTHTPNADSVYQQPIGLQNGPRRTKVSVRTHKPIGRARTHTPCSR